MKCKFCGADLLGNSSFCVKCGKNNYGGNEKQNNEIKSKAGFFSGLFKRKEKSEVTKECRDTTMEQPNQNVGENNCKAYFCISEEIEQDLIQKSTFLCDNLNMRLNRMKYELEEICKKTRYFPILDIVNKTIRVFDDEVYCAVDKALEEWGDSLVSVYSMAGDDTLEAAIRIEENIREIFYNFWSTNLFKEVIYIDTSRPGMKIENIYELKGIYTRYFYDIQSLSKKIVNHITEQEQPAYNIFVPAFKAITEPIKKTFEGSCAKIDNFVMDMESIHGKNVDIDMENNLLRLNETISRQDIVKKEHPIIPFLRKCSREISLIPGDKYSKADLINLRMYGKVQSIYDSIRDVDIATRKSVEILNIRIEELCRPENNKDIKNELIQLQIIRYKILRRAILFFADKYNGRKPEITALSYTLENIYASISLNVNEYKHFCETKMSGIEKKKTEYLIIDNSSIVGDLKTVKIIGQADIKYNICTFGAKFHIGFGVTVTIQIGDNVYRSKTHNSIKGRIDGLKRFYSENDINLGDTLEAIYFSKDNKIVIKK